MNIANCNSQESTKGDRSMNTGDTAFLLVSAALVLLMTFGLALFYAGMVRSKNTLGTIMQSFIIIGVIKLCMMVPKAFLLRTIPA